MLRRRRRPAIAAAIVMIVIVILMIAVVLSAAVVDIIPTIMVRMSIVLQLLVAGDVPDAGDRFQSGRHARWSSDGLQVQQRQHRHHCRRRTTAIAIVVVRVALIRRAGQVGHAGVVEGGLAAVMMARAEAVAVAAIVTIGTWAVAAIGTAETARGGWNATAVPVAAVVLRWRLSSLGIAAGRPTQSTKHYCDKNSSWADSASPGATTVAPVSICNQPNQIKCPNQLNSVRLAGLI